MTKVLYEPTGMLVSELGGVLAGAIFKQVWKVACHAASGRRSPASTR